TELSWVTAYTYDAVGQLTKLTRPDGSTLALAYGKAHRLKTVTDSFGNYIAFMFDAASNLVGEQVFNASNTLIRTKSYTYDAASRMRQAIGGLGQTTNYAHDPAGNITQITDPLGHVTNEAYDALNRLGQSIDPNGGATSYTYDPKSRLAG